jgi:sortase A
VTEWTLWGWGPPAPTHHDSWWRMLLRGIGQLLITLGVVVLLFVVYELYITGLKTARAQHQLLNEFTQGIVSPGNPAPHPVPIRDVKIGDGIAVMYVPRFGHNWHMVIVQGTDEASLQKGPGHYTSDVCGCPVAGPGQLGNFDVAGHRTTYLAPFGSIDTLRPGDHIYVETHQMWFTYTVEDIPPTPGYPDVRYQEIVDPSDVAVAYPVPDQPDPTKKPKLRLMTMTACNPKYSAAQRIVVHSLMTDERPVGLGPPPALAEGR